MIVPLTLFCDDTSGNRSKQWNVFNSWLLLLAGLPKYMNTQLHFICTSNVVPPLVMAKPIVADLIKLQEGMFMYDAYLDEEVLVIAPLFAFIADNPMASTLVNHPTGQPNKFCHICDVSLVQIHNILHNFKSA